jgi:hypothetical protein
MSISWLLQVAIGKLLQITKANLAELTQGEQTCIGVTVFPRYGFQAAVDTLLLKE